jgi:hypothetical protein
VTVNQSAAPTGTALGGYQFQELGVFFPTLTSSGTGTLTVVLDAGSADSKVVADAIGSAPAWASSGGPSPFESEPSYQLTFQNTRQRTTPDVAFDASENSGVTSFQNGSLTYGNFGTSLAAPCWAGLIAIANQGRVADGSETFNSGLDPTQTLQALYGLPASDFHTITTGYNGFNAGDGYDLVTGLGSPVANLLIPGLVSFGVATQLGQLVITVGPPASVAAGSAFGLTVAIVDSSGNVVTSYDASVAVSLAANPGASTLSGGLTAPVSDGVATFSGLTLNKAGSGYTLKISGGALAPVNTAPFDVTSSSTQSQGPAPGPSPTPSPTPGSTPPPAPAPTHGALVTHTMLTVRSRTSAFGQPVTLSATVKIIGGARTMPAGSVTFTDASSILATVPLHGDKASFTTSALPFGQNVIGAAYGGAADAERSKSAVVIETIRGVKSKTELSSSANPSRLGQATTLTARVSGSGGGSGAPTGTVTFVDGATILGSVALTGGEATLATDALAARIHRIKAEYSGNAIYNPSNSKVLKQTVKQSVTISSRTSSLVIRRDGFARLLARDESARDGNERPSGTNV